MLKAFNAVAAAPLTHPLPNEEDWGISRIERVTEPMSAFVQAVLSPACNPQVLLDVGALRGGVPVNMDVDAGNAWWCNPPLLMQAGASGAEGVGTALHTSATRAAPRRRYICKGPTATPMQPNFAWPAHHYSSILEKWSSLAMLQPRASQVQAHGIASLTAHAQLQQDPSYRCCPLPCLSLGMQPTLLLFSTDNVMTRSHPASSSANGLLPLTAFLAASVYQARQTLPSLCFCNILRR
jgi:hypothetical protein